MTDIKDEKKDTINLVCATNEKYAMPLTVMLKSVILNYSSDRLLRIYIMHNGLTEIVKEKITDSLRVNPYLVEIDFIHYKIKNNINIFSKEIFTEVANYRFFIHEVLPLDVKKVIYLDCDLIVNENIDELWNIDIGNSYSLAVREQSKKYLTLFKRFSKHLIKIFEIKNDNYYFNSGVMLINLEKWREDKMIENVIKISNLNIGSKESIFHCPDQDILNIILNENWISIDPRWNFCLNCFYTNKIWLEGSIKNEKEYRNLIMHPYIIHFNGLQKPWDDKYSGPYKFIFDYYKSMTLW